MGNKKYVVEVNDSNSFFHMSYIGIKKIHFMYAFFFCSTLLRLNHTQVYHKKKMKKMACKSRLQLGLGWTELLMVLWT